MLTPRGWWWWWQQRNGRIQRNGNQHDVVGIHCHVAWGTFDAFMFGTVERKARGFAQLYRMDGQARVRSEDIGDETDVRRAQGCGCRKRSAAATVLVGDLGLQFAVGTRHCSAERPGRHCTRPPTPTPLQRPPRRGFSGWRPC